MPLRKRNKKVLEEVDLGKKEVSLEIFDKKVKDLHAVVEQRKELEKQEKDLKEIIKDYVSDFAEKDALGNMQYLFKDYGGKKVFLERVVRRTSVLDNDKAEKFFKERGLYDMVTDKVISDVKIKQLIDSGEITVEEVQSLAKVNESYATVFKVVKRDVEEN